MHGQVQMLVSVVKMATVLEGVVPKSSVLLCVFWGQKDSLQRVFIKKCFLYTVGSVCRIRRFTTGSRNSLKDHVLSFISICDYLLTLPCTNTRGTAFWSNLEKYETYFGAILSGEYSEYSPKLKL
jgi:hypothetical protein